MIEGTHAEGDAGPKQPAARAVRRVAQHHGDPVGTGTDAAEGMRRIAHDVHDLRVVQGDRVSDGGQIAIEEHVIVVAGGHALAGGSPGHDEVAGSEHGPSPGSYELDARWRLACDGPHGDQEPGEDPDGNPGSGTG